MKLNDAVVFFPILTAEVCGTIIDEFERHESEHIRRNNEAQKFTELNLHSAVPDLARFVAVNGVNKAAELYKDLHDPFGGRFFPECYGLEQLRVKRYNKDDCFKMHVDVGNLESSKRFLAFLFYLNDDFEGGETHFKTPDSHLIKPLTGNVVVFPPTLQYAHQGLPVKEGTKYIMSSYLNYV